MSPAKPARAPTPTSSPARLVVPGSRLAVLGAGRSGLAAARLARRLGAASVLLADAAGDTSTIGSLDSEGITARFELGPRGALSSADLDALDAVILSPGIDPALPLVAAAAACGLPILGELEFAWQQTDRPVVAVTGTNGKTTTTELIVRLLQHAGRRCRPAGNHGLPLSELLLDEIDGGGRDDVHVLEVSSFQLEAIHSFRPRVAVWLNFAADHLDRYPDLEAYRQAKARVFEFMQPEDTAVINAREPVPCGRAREVRFSLEPDVAPARWTWAAPHLCCRDRPRIALDHTRLRGRHNIDNLLAAAAAAEALLGDDAGFESAVIDYQPPPHRYEWVADIDGRSFINDSKATNLHALEAALLAGDEPVVLIAGGKDKQLDFSALTSLVAERCRAVVAIGEITPRLLAAWSPSLPCQPAADVAAAARQALAASAPGDRILFAPGTSSFDMFSGYAARGEAFRNAVQQLHPIT